jgi:probable rRNA maturation factor
MQNLQLSIQIEDPFVSLVDKAWLGKVVGTTLSAAGVGELVDIGLVIASDETVQNLNRSYRGVDASTDVLAFALTKLGSGEVEHFAMPPDKILHLGEVIVSYRQAERQAEEQHHPIERELALLVAHGVLHLLGYDHGKPEAEQSMRTMEAEILNSIETD